MRNSELDVAQDQFEAKHGTDAMRQLHWAIEAVAQCSVTGGWPEILFFGTAKDLYTGLVDVDQVTPDAMGSILQNHQNHRTGPIGWDLIRRWQVVVLIWQKDQQPWTSHSERHEGLVDGAGDLYRNEYEAALREFVRSELSSYIFGPRNWEHQRDVESARAREGEDRSFDAHGVASFFNTRAAIASVQDIFDKVAACPGTIPLDVYIEAMNIAYEAAASAGHPNDLRAFADVEEDIKRRGFRGALSDEEQRRLAPRDDFLRYAGATPFARSIEQDGEGIALDPDAAAVLRNALASFPSPIESREGDRLYAAAMRCLEAGWLQGEDVGVSVEQRYELTLTKAGRTVLSTFVEVPDGEGEIVHLNIKVGRELVGLHIDRIHKEGNSIDMGISAADADAAKTAVKKANPSLIRRCLELMALGFVREATKEFWRAVTS